MKKIGYLLLVFILTFSISNSTPLNSTGGGTTISGSVADPSTLLNSFIISNPSGTGKYALWRSPVNITITAMHVLCVGGTSVAGNLWEFDSNGENGSAVGAVVTANAGTINNSTTFTNATISAGNFVGWEMSNVSGTPTRSIITFEYTED